MPHITLPSPLGDLTIFEEAGAIVALEFGRAGESPRANKGRAGESPRANKKGAVPPTGGQKKSGKDKPSALLKRAARQLDDYFDGKRRTFDVPLKPAGTAFQRKVWTRLLAIPPGRVGTYGAIAKQLKSGARAVGTACGANPIPLLIPCHRVLGAGGRLGGYSGEGGVATKRWLLEHEGATL